VEDGEETDHAHRGSDRRLYLQGDHRAEDNDRSGDADLDERQIDPRHTGGAAGSHHEHERAWHQPQRPPAELRGKNPDRHHRQDVIEPADRMHEAMDEAVGYPGAGMGKGSGWREQQGCEGEARNLTHGVRSGCCQKEGSSLHRRCRGPGKGHNLSRTVVPVACLVMPEVETDGRPPIAGAF
jgi:hypothetical protein